MAISGRFVAMERIMSPPRAWPRPKRDDEDIGRVGELGSGDPDGGGGGNEEGEQEGQ